MNRNTFIKTALGSFTLAGTASLRLNARSYQDPAPLDPKLVKAFVIAGHSKPEKVKEMLADHPNLLYCRHDWGNGDFEEAIEGAGHVGNADIANFLIEQGARVNLFVLTMLGRTALVKPILEAYPRLLQAKGAHGFTLLHHAKVGGKKAEALYAYLTEKGLKKTQVKID